VTVTLFGGSVLQQHGRKQIAWVGALIVDVEHRRLAEPIVDHLLEMRVDSEPTLSNRMLDPGQACVETPGEKLGAGDRRSVPDQCNEVSNLPLYQYSFVID
jgi:hypothetical protein